MNELQCAARKCVERGEKKWKTLQHIFHETEKGKTNDRLTFPHSRQNE